MAKEQFNLLSNSGICGVYLQLNGARALFILPKLFKIVGLRNVYFSKGGFT
jgi:hypothetical protein